jgi:hypothetical protein
MEKESPTNEALIQSIEAIEEMTTRDECGSDGGSSGRTDTNDSIE